jgi:hypothetical protein
MPLRLLHFRGVIQILKIVILKNASSPPSLQGCHPDTEISDFEKCLFRSFTSEFIVLAIF